jgi:2-polyprenyl-3-methyl-5-hydroxy-6-metoxy-1,4-benzoquinol methylase
MRHAARFLVRGFAFALMRVFGFLERRSRGLAFATFSGPEIAALGVAEWEAFGESDFIGHQGPFSWEKSFFADHIREGDRLLVVGAGAGRDVLPLIEAGHDVTALDIAPQALQILTERALRQGFSVKTLHGSITSTALPAAAFDVVLFSWFCYGYLLGPGERRSALDRSRAALRPGGRVLISYQPVASVVSPPFPRAARLVAKALGGLGVREGDHFTLSGTARNPHALFLHAFRTEEIENEVRRAGLDVVFHDQPSKSLGRLASVLRPLEQP